ncbi:MAG TPA: hypothetical protein VGS80_14280 [Ktedonobacterales bacterium]|nr:hypothetical protein [Ktedonobacterales bacterium]
MRAGFAYALSLVLDLVSGYGSKVERCFLTYVAVVLFFTAAHLTVGIATHHPLSILDALAMTIQSLHGRNFTFLPTGLQVAVNTAEAVVGLIVEALVVAVITRRILGLGWGDVTRAAQVPDSA